MPYLIALARSVPTALHVAYYARRVRGAAVRRQLIECCREITGRAQEGEAEVAVLVDGAHEQILRVTTREQSAVQSVPAAVLMAEALEMLHPEGSGVQGIATGFPDLDAHLNGLIPGNLVLLAARPSVGKTALGLQIALNAAMAGVPVEFYSLEMPRQQIATRLLANALEMDLMQIAQRFWPKGRYDDAAEAAAGLAETPLEVCDDCELSPLAIRNHLRRRQREVGIKLAVIDYLQQFPLPRGSGNFNEAYTQLVHQVRTTARSLEIPILLLCQLSRNVERREDKRPILADLRDSGSLEQEADVVLMLYRAGYYREDKPTAETLEVLIRKNRQGALGRVNLWYDLKTQRIKDNVDLYHDDPPAPHWSDG